jgi:hypothetical protein
MPISTLRQTANNTRTVSRDLHRLMRIMDPSDREAIRPGGRPGSLLPLLLHYVELDDDLA